jgi:hypothetical protein
MLRFIDSSFQMRWSQGEAAAKRRASFETRTGGAVIRYPLKA